MASIRRPSSGSSCSIPHLHLPGDFAIAEMAFDAAAQAGNVLGFREIHLEQEPGAGAEGQQILRCLEPADDASRRARTAWPIRKLRRRPIPSPARECRTLGCRCKPDEISGSGGDGACRGYAPMSITMSKAYSPPRNPREDLIAARARVQGDIDHFGALALAPGAGRFVEFAEGPSRSPDRAA